MGSDKQVRAVKGMNDVLPRHKDAFLDSAVWRHIMQVTTEVLESFGYRRAWLPVVEETSLFARGIGTETDIVSKEMYSFEDRGERKLTLRPEGTAGAVRAYVQHNLPNIEPVQRWWYIGPMYRAERPQKGRYRQFYQIGAELFGVAEPAADAELLTLLWRWCERLGLSIRVRVNSLGDGESRAAYRTALQEYFRGRAGELDERSAELIESNPLRILDAKDPKARAVAHHAPEVLDSHSDGSRRHFDAVRALLEDAGVPFEVDTRLVRGLDYYTGTVFEFTTDALGAQDAVLGGGRYDGLVEALGGVATPAIGFAAGVERLALLCAETLDLARTGPDLYVAWMGDGAAYAAAVRLADEVRACRCRVEVDLAGGRLKHQMKRADRSGARSAVVLGEDELRSGRGRLKDLRESNEVEVELSGEAIAALLSARPIQRGD